MCFEVTNTSEKAISIIYAQFRMQPNDDTVEEAETRHRETIPAGEVQKIRYASSVEEHPSLSVTQMADRYWEADELPEPGPVAD